MKRIIAMLLAVMMLLTLAACGGNDQTADNSADDVAVANDAVAQDDQEEAAGDADAAAADDVAEVQADAGVYSFTYEGVELVPGAAFDSTVLPEPESVYEVPSCAIEGTDNVYNYGVLEVTAFDEGNGEHIYSVFIIDANTPTAEGLYIFDTLETVDTLLGTDRVEEGNQLTYQKGDTLLVLIMEDDRVASIEYRWDNV